MGKYNVDVSIIGLADLHVEIDFFRLSNVAAKDGPFVFVISGFSGKDTDGILTLNLFDNTFFNSSVFANSNRIFQIDAFPVALTGA